MTLRLRQHLAPHVRALIADMRQGDKVGTKPEQHRGRHLEISSRIQKDAEVSHTVVAKLCIHPSAHSLLCRTLLVGVRLV